MSLQYLGPISPIYRFKGAADSPAPVQPGMFALLVIYIFLELVQRDRFEYLKDAVTSPMRLRTAVPRETLSSRLNRKASPGNPLLLSKVSDILLVRSITRASFVYGPYR